jgi:integrase
MSLTDIQIRQAKPKDRPYRRSDGHGLFIEIRPNGSKLWRYQYRLGNKQKLYAMGAYPEITLVAARDELKEARRLVQKGIDPVYERKNLKAQQIDENQKTFKVLAQAWIEKRSSKWSEQYKDQISRSFIRHVYPLIGKRPINSLTAVDVLDVLEAVQTKGPTLATMMRQWMSGVFRYAIVRRLIDNDPASMLRGEIERPPPKKKEPLTPAELPGFFKALDEYSSRSQVQRTTVIAINMLMLTFVRTGELRQAKWNEIDWGQCLWRVPAERMKKRRDHLVPLSNQAVILLKELQEITGQREWLFPNTRQPKKCMANTTINRALEYMGYVGRLSGHAFRNTASTRLHELGYDTDHIELQLAHVDKSVRGRYNSARHLEKRTQLMQGWADYLDQHKQELGSKAHETCLNPAEEKIHAREN